MNTMPISLFSLGCAFEFVPLADSTLIALRVRKGVERQASSEVNRQIQKAGAQMDESCEAIELIP